ncbi:conserved repeat domain protein [gamma proteobacterium HTCC5015]|nr:conserved repeat domain protein [gamma proteobacterium HTCC5015]
MYRKFWMKALVAIAVTGFAGQLLAAAPANSVLRNTAELSYTGLGTPIQATVSVTIDLTPTAPTLSAPVDNTVAENQASTFTYNITSNANGNDVYQLTSSTALNNLTAAPSVAFTQGGVGVASITLGATAARVGSAVGSNTITVPSDGSAGGSVNGLTGGDTVVIDGNVYVINGVADNGTTATISLASNLTTVVAVGDPIFEQQSFDATIDDVGTITTSGTPASVELDTTATSQSDAAQSSTDQTITNVTELAFEKFVTNETNVNGGAPVGIDFDGDSIDDQNFYTTASNVRAESGDTLRYAIRLIAPAGSSLTGVEFSDVLPVFTTYVAGSTELNGNAVADDAGPASPLIAGMAVNSPGEAAGTVNPGESAVVTFRVMVD